MLRKRKKQPRGRGRPIRRGSLLEGLRIWTGRLAVIVMVLVAGTLIAIDRFNPPAVREFRTGVTDFFTPAIEAVSAPFHAAADWFDAFESNATVRERNAELERKVERLRLSLQEMAAMEEENRRLRELVNAGSRIKGRHLTAAVTVNSGGPYVRSLTVRAGSVDGLRRGMAVINADGYIGRIVEVGRRTSRVLPVTDLNSRIPVHLAKTGLRALLAGTNGRRMRLYYVPSNVSVSVGTLIVTSGLGEVLPPGLPIGRVDSVGPDAILVRPLVNWNRLAFVRIVDHEAPGLVERLPGNRQQQEAGRRAENR